MPNYIVIDEMVKTGRETIHPFLSLTEARAFIKEHQTEHRHLLVMPANAFVNYLISVGQYATLKHSHQTEEDE